MVRLMLNDELWSRLLTVMCQYKIHDKPSLRMMVEGMLYRMRTGLPWRDLPTEFGVKSFFCCKFPLIRSFAFAN